MSPSIRHSERVDALRRFEDLLRQPWSKFSCLGIVREVLHREIAPLPASAFPPDEHSLDARNVAVWIAASKVWDRVGDSARAATRVGDVLLSFSTRGEPHVSILISSLPPQVVLSSSIERGVYSCTRARVLSVVAVYRLRRGLS